MFGLCFTAQSRTGPESELTDFDVTRSTEDNFSVPHFTGKNADVRPLLDYTYHKKYSASRVQVQDDLIESFCKNCERRGNEMLPWVVFTAGAMGAGKGYVTRWMEKNGCFPLKNFIVVDPDAIRQKLPEWDLYVKHDAESAGERTQKEAGCLAEILGYRGLRERYNVMFDGSLRDAGWYTDYFRHLRRNFPGIRIMILHIMADRDEVLKRAELRGKQTGRVVPRELLEASMDAVPKSVGILASEADFVCRVMNLPGRDPEVQREPGSPSPPEGIAITWDLIKRLWDNIDADGDGSLSREEVQTAIAQGILTEKAVLSADKDGDGTISKKELFDAQQVAMEAGRKLYR